jgi:hypothetical protein
VARTLKPESNFLTGMPGEIVSTPIVSAHCKKPFRVEAKIRVFLWRQGIRAVSDQIAPCSPLPKCSPIKGHQGGGPVSALLFVLPPPRWGRVGAGVSAPRAPTRSKTALDAATEARHPTSP